ncbi:DUF1640 domain-containing protein [Acidisphaera sp. S103]|uniref:DUF1640 domain-containing protein n=1 Tax=Acidisphaera sp. S103 TaxID=1747223 RepID=UPI00131ECCAD|nr:DUF1640 domain-containing protein [Acidisphaera sp. S103]
MNAVRFDTLSMARKLQASGLESAVAAGMVEALVEGLNGGELATTADVARTTAAIDSLRIDLKTELATLHTQLKTENELLRREIVIKFGSMMVIGVGVMLTVMRYFLLHP